MAKLNVSKPRDDKVPYPDGLAPFHVPQPPPADPAPVKWYVGQDLYSLAVLLWLLLQGKYLRPQYAETDDVEEVYAAIQSHEEPNLSFLVDMELINELVAIFSLSWHAWIKEEKSMDTLMDFKKQLSEMVTFQPRSGVPV